MSETMSIDQSAAGCGNHRLATAIIRGPLGVEPRGWTLTQSEGRWVWSPEAGRCPNQRAAGCGAQRLAPAPIRGPLGVEPTGWPLAERLSESRRLVLTAGCVGGHMEPHGGRWRMIPLGPDCIEGLFVCNVNFPSI